MLFKCCEVNLRFFILEDFVPEQVSFHIFLVISKASNYVMADNILHLYGLLTEKVETGKSCVGVFERLFNVTPHFLLQLVQVVALAETLFENCN